MKIKFKSGLEPTTTKNPPLSATAIHVTTPNDSNDLVHPIHRDSKAIMVGGNGNIKVTMASGTQATFTGLVADTIYQFSVKRVWSTGTTAMGVIALY
ncbi:hypothetical protein CN692_07665 [Bacillus sp. AFS002410]|uniref:spike base protein, RCAP_Rcc01079 family n=1 Tax=Bacillus sp. AFS002410 TaxID=2033481 RepID=UPI000BF07CF0|nr:hypothetical protein [Bacillus sp. AFS002410]PEJ58845.1 hypothetical protein CN692_07665 [Bacillus sp. AFS002410]